jgi:hypothetical protein
LLLLGLSCLWYRPLRYHGVMGAVMTDEKGLTWMTIV